MAFSRSSSLMTSDLPTTDRKLRSSASSMDPFPSVSSLLNTSFNSSSLENNGHVSRVKGGGNDEQE